LTEKNEIGDKTYVQIKTNEQKNRRNSQTENNTIRHVEKRTNVNRSSLTKKTQKNVNGRAQRFKR
jgi:hypothetical protein